MTAIQEGKARFLHIPSTGLVFALAVVGGVAAAAGPLAGAALAIPLALGLMLLNASAGLPLLIAVAALNRVGVSWGDAEIRVEIVVALLLAAVVANRIAVRTLPLSALASPLVLPLCGYTLANLVASLLFAAERSRGLKLDAEIVASVITYVVVVALIRSGRDLRRALDALWMVTVAEAALGLLLVALFAAHATHFGVQINETGLPMAYGTQWEANIFGSYLLGNLFVLLGDYVGSDRSRVRSMGLILIVLAIGASLTRTVWISLALSGILFLLLSGLARRAARGLLPVVLAFPAVMLTGLVLGTATPLASRLMDLVNLQGSSATGRFTFFAVAIREWERRPILGNGTGSFNYNAMPGQPHPWLPNLFLLTLHDAGIVGLLALLWAIVAFYRTCLRGLSPNNPLSPVLVGSVAGFTGLMFAFQMTTGFWFAYPWIVTGIGIAATRISAERA